MNDFILSPVPLAELLERMRILNREEIVYANQNTIAEKLLSPKEACNLFQPAVSRPTLTSWTSRGLVPVQKIGGTVFYKTAIYWKRGKGCGCIKGIDFLRFKVLLRIAAN